MEKFIARIHLCVKKRDGEVRVCEIKNVSISGVEQDDIGAFFGDKLASYKLSASILWDNMTELIVFYVNI